MIAGAVSLAAATAKDSAARSIVAGDDDQTIYSFTGATPEAMLDPDIPEDPKIILKQSYRVPRAVHGLAKRPDPAGDAPPGQGVPATWTGRERGAPDARIVQSDPVRHPQERDGAPQAGADRDVPGVLLVYAAPLVAVLRQHVIPFHNPYRKSNGLWNPLQVGRRGSTASRILALLASHPDYGPDYHFPWTHGDLALWAEILEAKDVLRHGAKKGLAAYDPDTPVGMEQFKQIFKPAALESLSRAYDGGDLLKWWRSRVSPSLAKRVQFPADIAAKWGPHALSKTPQIMSSTWA